MNLDLILTIAAGLVGFPALWAFVIDVLKWAGVVNDGTAGKWSALGNLLALLMVAALVNFWPDTDISGLDAALNEYVKFAVMVFGYVVQIAGTKGFHSLYAKKLPWASHSG